MRVPLDLGGSIARCCGAAALLGFAVASCGPIPLPPRASIFESHVDGSYRYAAIVEAANSAPVPIEVRGTAASLSDRALADAVVQNMPGRSLGLVQGFTRATDQTQERVVWVFGASEGLFDDIQLPWTSSRDRFDALCGGSFPEAPASADRLNIAAAYCFGPMALSAARAKADDITDVSNPGFSAVIVAMTMKLFPIQPSARAARDALEPASNVVVAVE
jgi:hypothetical protein